jgi:uroporphyrinogen decarboxylase
MSLNKFQLKKQKHDFNTIIDVISGTKKLDEVLYLEFQIDEEIRKVILEEYLNEKYYGPPKELFSSNVKLTSSLSFKELKKDYKRYYENSIMFFHRMGYSLYVDLTFLTHFKALNTISVKGKDTAKYSKGDREWANTSNNMIMTWQDFEEFPWQTIDKLIEEDLYLLDLFKDILPSGMKIAISSSLFEFLLEWIFGYEKLFLLLYDNPDLVSETFNRIGEKVLKFYDLASNFESVGCIWHADDLGYKNGTMLSVDDLKKLVFPWLKKYVNIAHTRNLPFFYHTCGKKDEIMDIFIKDIDLDAIHSFEDEIQPVIEFKKIWGDRIGIIGGVDMDKICRYENDKLKKYIMSILDYCVPKGRYICGTGNTVANYIPVENYLLMVEIFQNWNKV